MKTRRVLKKSVVKIFYLIIAFIILIIGIFSLVKYYNGDFYKLTKLGYNKEEVRKIIDLNKTDLILKLGYNEKILEIMDTKYYLEKNIEKYINYYNSNKDKDLNDIIAIVNVHANNEFYSLDLNADTSKGYSMLVNKYYKLDSDYENENLSNVKNWYAYGKQKLDDEVYEQFIKMFNDAKKENLTIIINEAYRSYEEQEKSYKKYDDDYAARPGYSEHQTGFAIDIISPTSNGETFDLTEEFAWVTKHAHEYGFILRYPKDKEYLTGYKYESWHYRYLGSDLATKVYNSGLTFDEYYAYYLDK